MKKMLLSLKPDIFELIRSGKKIFEYRHQFYVDKIDAYIYVSKPIQKIVGYIEFDKRIELNDWKEIYKDNKEIGQRIDDYINRNYKYVMPIKKFIMTSAIGLDDLKKDLNKFVIPESYYYLDNFNELEKYIEKNIEFTDEVIENSFNIVKDEDICRKKY